MTLYADAFITARHLTTGRKEPILVVVIHTTENRCANGIAMKVAYMFAAPGAPEASAHYIVGPDAVVQCVQETDTAWAAPGSNSNGIHVEHTAFAGFTDNDWHSTDAEKMLLRSAALVADICTRNDIPVERLSVECLRAGKRGIAGHKDINDAFHLGDHWDPGGHFPWDRYLEMVKQSQLDAGNVS